MLILIIKLSSYIIHLWNNNTVGLVSLCDVAMFGLIIPMLEVDDKKDLSRSTNDVDDGDNLPAFWLNNVKGSGIFRK